MKVVFMGTPEFAAGILNALYKEGHEITAVYTQPDKPKGRSGALIASPVKEFAINHDIPVYQPDRIRKPEYVEELKSIPADVFVVAAFGQILSEEILNIPKFGCINVHGSLLPKYRGAAPIQRAIADGETVTGVSIMAMDKGIDTGDVYSMVSFPIMDDDDEKSIYEKMALYGSKELIEVLKKVETSTAVAKPQDNSMATYAPMLKKEEGLINFNATMREIDCKVRGFREWPTAYTYCNKKMIKVISVKPCPGEHECVPGTLTVLKKNIYVSCKDGLLELIEVLPEGKKKMSGMDFARGFHLATGDSLSNER